MLYVIFATTNSNIFGSSSSNKMLWNNKDDLNFFKRKTTKNKTHKQNVVIMGRNTADSLSSPLKNRINIVITSKDTYKSGFEVFHTLDSAIEWSFNNYGVENIFVIGGLNLIYETLEKYIPRRVYWNKLNESITQNDDDDNLLYFDSKKLNKYELYKTNTIENIQYNTFVKTNKKNSINPQETNYLYLLRETYTHGEHRFTRNGCTFSLFGKSLEFDVSNKFPLLTTKKMFLRGIFEELKFFLLGQTNTNILSEKGVKIWEGNTSREFLDKNGFYDYDTGYMGPMYGYQWRNFNGENHDQLETLIYDLQYNENSRRLLMTTYNPLQASEGVLYPCHGIVTQFYVNKHKQLSCIMHQRSADMFLGVPFNIASYSLLLYILCKLTGHTPHKLIINFGDVHIYDSHVQQIMTQFERDTFVFPTLTINKNLKTTKDIESLMYEDIQLHDYSSHSVIKANMIA